MVLREKRKECKVCGQTGEENFYAGYASKCKQCVNKDQLSMRRVRRYDVTCVMCKKIFKAKSLDKKYCDECREEKKKKNQGKQKKSSYTHLPKRDRTLLPQGFNRDDAIVFLRTVFGGMDGIKNTINVSLDFKDLTLKSLATNIFHCKISTLKKIYLLVPELEEYISDVRRKVLIIKNRGRLKDQFKKCKCCDVPFIPSNTSKKYCSLECAKFTYNAKSTQRHILHMETNDEYRKNCKAYESRYHKERYKNDQFYNILTNLRSSITSHVSRFVEDPENSSIRKKGKSVNYLGIDLEGFVVHIEDQFTDGMSWDNRGKDGWHFDHVRPLASFPFEDYEVGSDEFESLMYEAWNYSNFQPLWAFDNLSKNSFYEGEKHFHNSERKGV